LKRKETFIKRVLLVVTAVILLLDVSALASVELKFQIKNISPQYVLFLKGKSSVQNIGQDMGKM
jgi:hypothetical protein